MAVRPNYMSMDKRTRAYREEKAAYDKRKKAYNKRKRAAKKAGGNTSGIG